MMETNGNILQLLSIDRLLWRLCVRSTLVFYYWYYYYKKQEEKQISIFLLLHRFSLPAPIVCPLLDGDDGLLAPHTPPLLSVPGLAISGEITATTNYT